jgi:hypothetical protein
MCPLARADESRTCQQIAKIENREKTAQSHRPPHIGAEEILNQDPNLPIDQCLDHPCYLDDKAVNK